MINAKKFALLGNNQKIYKIASTLRTMETTLKNGGVLNPQEIFSYCKYIAHGTDKKIAQALQILAPVLDLDQARLFKEKLKILNFAYHRLLALIDKNEDSDAKFSFLRFDGTNTPLRYSYAAVLDNLRSPMNVGSIFRTADGFGTGELSLCGICPHPPHPKIIRTALGAENIVPHQYFETTEEALVYWKNKAYKIYALEVAEPSLSLSALESFENCVFILGNEEFGITENTLTMADAVVRIPMSGMKNSLNVANSFAVLAYCAQNYFLEHSYE